MNGKVSDDLMEITYDRKSEHFIFKDVLGLELDEAGHLMYESGGYVGTCCGKESLRIDEVGGYSHDEDAPHETLLICDSFPCIADLAMDRDDVGVE